MKLFKVTIQLPSGAGVVGQVYAQSYASARKVAKTRFNGRIAYLELVGA